MITIKDDSHLIGKIKTEDTELEVVCTRLEKLLSEALLIDSTTGALLERLIGPEPETEITPDPKPVSVNGLLQTMSEALFQIESISSRTRETLNRLNKII